MRFSKAIDAYIRDMRAEGRINSEDTERAYRGVLNRLAAAVNERDPGKVSRVECKEVIQQWTHPNSMAHARSIMVSFFDWATSEDMCIGNPARATRPPKRKEAKRVRLTREEADAILACAREGIEGDAVALMYLHGLRRHEVIGLCGVHLRRDGWLQVVGKGDKERWIPVHPDWRARYEVLRDDLADEQRVVPAQRWRNPPANTEQRSLAETPISAKAVWDIARRCARRAGVVVDVGAHSLRHAYAEHTLAGLPREVKQYLLGHTRAETTDLYTGEVPLDEILRWVVSLRTDKNPVEAA